MYHYALSGDHYYLVKDDGDVVDIGEEVAVLYDEVKPGNTVLLKHGRPTLVSDYFSEITKIYRENDLSDMLDHIKLIVGRFPIDDLNKMISTTGYIGSFMNRHVKKV